MNQKQIAVIGGGVAGVCTAYFLARAGHEVVLIEQDHNVAQGTSFADSGVVSPTCGGIRPTPGMPAKILSSFFRATAPVMFRPGLDPAFWRWASRWMEECESERYLTNMRRLLRLASYSRTLLRQLREQHGIQYESQQGVLQVFRSSEELDATLPMRELLTEHDVRHQILDADAAAAVEPALADREDLHCALYLPADESGNCPLFAKQMRHVCESVGVGFHFTRHVDAIDPQGGRVQIHIGEQSFTADAAVITAGADSLRLLDSCRRVLPLYPVRSYAATVAIRDFDGAPRASLLDHTYKTSITRLDDRIRIAGIVSPGARAVADQQKAANRTLAQIGSDWFPHAANYHKSTFWSGVGLLSSDGLPVLGATPLPNIHVNLAHGLLGWSLAVGCGRMVADILSGKSPEIDPDGLTLLHRTAET